MTDVVYDFSNRVVAVTGAATGIGAAVAAVFARAGAKVYLLDIDVEGGTEVAGQLDRAVFVGCDVTDPEQVEEVFERIRTDDGGWMCWSTTPAASGCREPPRTCLSRSGNASSTST